jgi:hypothetical protein
MYEFFILVEIGLVAYWAYRVGREHEREKVVKKKVIKRKDFAIYGPGTIPCNPDASISKH